MQKHPCVPTAFTYFLDHAWQWDQGPHLLEQRSRRPKRRYTIDASLPMGHSLLARAYLVKRQHEQAIAAAERAITLDRNWAPSYLTLSEILRFSQRPQEAVALAEKAMRLNPRYPFSQTPPQSRWSDESGAASKAVARVYNC